MSASSIKRKDSHELKKTTLPRLNSANDEMNVTVTEYNSTNVNPSPIKLPKDGVELLEEFLSPRKLQALTGVDNLETVEYLEMRVNTEQMSLGNFGMYLPNLSQIRLSGSFIPSIRDLGTSLWNLQVLWMPQCNLRCLDGLVTLSNLHELYLAYNEVEDVSSCGMLENLEILDLEGNIIEDSCNIHYLSMCHHLTRLTLESNPLCRNQPDYRSIVLDSIPQLEYLDDIPRDNIIVNAVASLTENGAGDVASNSSLNNEEDLLISPKCSASNDFQSHWNFINSVLLESNLLATTAQTTTIAMEKSTSLLDSSPTDSGRPASSSFASSLSTNSSFLPATSARPNSAAAPFRRPLSSPGGRPDTSSTLDSLSDNASMSETGPDDSSLTAGQLVCGSLTKSLRSIKKQTNNGAGPIGGRQINSGRSLQVDLRNKHPITPRPVTARPNLVSISPEPFDDVSCDEIMKELSQWRKDYEKSKARIEALRAPQVLTIDYSENEIEEIQQKQNIDEINKHDKATITNATTRTKSSLNNINKQKVLNEIRRPKAIGEKTSNSSTNNESNKFKNEIPQRKPSSEEIKNFNVSNIPPNKTIKMPVIPKTSEPPKQISRIRRQLIEAGSTSLAPSRPTLKKSE